MSADRVLYELLEIAESTYSRAKKNGNMYAVGWAAGRVVGIEQAIRALER